MKKIISASNAPSAIGPYSQGTDIGNMVFLSGQIPTIVETGEFPEGISAQTKQSLTNVQNLLAEAGLTMSNIVKTTVFLSDMENFTDMNAVYTTFFEEGSYPARSTVEVARLPKDALVEIEVIAVR